MTSRSDEALGSMIAARNASKKSVVVFDLSDRTQIEITGADRVRFLHNFTSNDIKRLKVGHGCETFITNIKGKVVAHVFAFCSENLIWLDGTPGQVDAITSHLRKFVLIDDVQLIPRTTDRGELFVTGPLSPSLLQVDQLTSVGDHITRETGGTNFDIRRVDILGQPGFLLSIPQPQLNMVKQSMIGLGVVEGTSELFELLRVESGYPQFGIDITDDNLAQEVARTKQCISFDKGCYLGQETIARLDALGHTNRELKRLRFSNGPAPKPMSLIFDETGTTEIGVVTSASQELNDTIEQANGGVVALGMVKRNAIQVNTQICVRDGSQVTKGVVL